MIPQTAQPPASPEPQTAPKPQPKAVTADEIVSTEMPPVTGGSPAPGTAPETAPKAETPPELIGAVDALNRPFDPEKFRPEKDSLGRWKNRRGGKKPRSAAVSGGSGGAGGSFIPPEPPGWQTPPGSESGNPQTAPGSGTAPGTAQPQTGTAEMPAASPKAVAEVATNGVYALTGALIRNPKAARPLPAEHANLRDTAAAYLEARGIRFVGGAAIGIGLLAYCIGDDTRRAAIWDGIVAVYNKLFRKPPMKTVPPATPETAPQTAAQPQTGKPPPPGTVSAFGNA